jgi:endonuclease-8
MPEGDTIFRAATALRKVLAGNLLIGARSPLAGLAKAKLAGLRVTRVDSLGKNLLIEFADGRVLRTHMRMTGSWHIYRTGERWWKPEHLARVVLETREFVAVCFNAPVVELLPAGGREQSAALAGLGPDILAPEFDLAGALARFRARGEMPLGEALLDQGLVAGIGNIYKSETLFVCRTNPFGTVAELSESALKRVLLKARGLMSANLQNSGRTTTRAFPGSSPFWVYKRSGKVCLRCGTRIAMKRQGAQARSTYWCPKCQAGGAVNRSAAFAIRGG